MKKIFLFLSVFATILTSITFVSLAQADGCSADNPCGGYAVLDSNNNVINTIVCDAATCGGGTFGGNTVVLQSPTNPDGSGRALGGFNSDNNTIVTYNSTTKTFNIPTSGPITMSNQTIVVNPDKTQTETQLSATVSSTSRTFNAPTNIKSLPIQLSEPSVTKDANVTLVVTEIGGASCVSLDNQDLCVKSTQQIGFTAPKTAQEIIAIVVNEKMNLIQKNINSLIKLVYVGGITK